ncbi:MAG: hypothetical protein HXS41_07475 [Theionarchaea archaeon]|nr:hypothetical protein [Theionarchaea archaeon]MBU7000168.1 hypothetical protein [Theionarchaea archaeon]MBU7020885.1 hypothetical protein [Theionarchaea archaeon]MBU7034972.1 hypothetical protein [Theionarchaea archaeon]MBU7039174.1 hypothetical protein [Theionarchaea archaeon]
MNGFLMISYEIGKQRMLDFQKEAENWRIAQSVRNVKQADDKCQISAEANSNVLQGVHAVKA